MGSRLTALNEWVKDEVVRLGLPVSGEIQLEAVSGDASFRRYFRLSGEGVSWIVMDAPPELEDSHPFVAVASAWHQAGVRVPQIVSHDLALGFLLLDDFGNTLLLSQLDDNSADALYGKALETLVEIQQQSTASLPPYDEALLKREMGLFREWFVQQLLGLSPGKDTRQMLDEVEDRLVDSALSQPQVCVHRDYHSRNLMALADGGVGVLDFQDAVRGAVTYDLVSLLRDAYIDWPDQRVAGWVESYRGMLEKQQSVAEPELFLQQFELMGMQRQLKVLGIFARLWLRDGKAGYLGDIPRTLSYLYRASGRYPVFSDFHAWLGQTVIPVLETNEHYRAQSLSHWWNT
ncbi:aminoglycoside phosphotransferase family protein [Nitrincola alkalilacustris]|uniref:aminoglycoside phosphotransferase family protein n=1 Tax=Nitrincola alkalilacustris TaxID=1571224 RepID=UPI00124E875A|nr:phosphotransferase [Nitrincola alkalilacustris]